MLPWVLIDSADVPGDDERLRLYRRGDEYSIRVGAYELMNSRVHASEDALARIACERIGDTAGANILIGGLGMGFTLAGVLARAGASTRIVVAELVPAVVAWNRGPLAELNGRMLDDPRVTIRETDVAETIGRARRAYDAIILDVDNGPAGLTSKQNDRLYGVAGLRAAFGALTPGGVLAVWSAGPDPRFTRRLQQAGFETEEMRVRARGSGGGSRFLIWVATRRA